MANQNAGNSNRLGIGLCDKADDCCAERHRVDPEIPANWRSRQSRDATRFLVSEFRRNSPFCSSNDLLAMLRVSLALRIGTPFERYFIQSTRPIAEHSRASPTVVPVLSGHAFRALNIRKLIAANTHTPIAAYSITELKPCTSAA